MVRHIVSSLALAWCLAAPTHASDAATYYVRPVFARAKLTARQIRTEVVMPTDGKLAIHYFERQLKTLSGLTPYEYIAKIWTSEPDRFIANPIHQIPSSISRLREREEVRPRVRVCRSDTYGPQGN